MPTSAFLGSACLVWRPHDTLMVARGRCLWRATVSIETFSHGGKIDYAVVVVIIAAHAVISTRVVSEFAVRLRNSVGEV